MTGALLLAAALLGDQPAGAPPPAAPDIKTLEASQFSGIARAREAVARTQAEWDALWREHARPGKPAPPVDFAGRMVVAVFLGSRSTGGYAVTITGTRMDGSTLVVEWREGAPGKRDITAQVLTAPAHLVEMPRHAGEVRFEKAAQP